MGQGTGDRGQGTGDRGQRTGDRGQGTGDRGQGTGDRGGDRGQGTGDRGQGTGDRGQGTGDRGQGTGDRGQGTGDRGQGTGDRGQGSIRCLKILYPDVKWTLDGRCGETLPDGSISECNPDKNPCCNVQNRCKPPGSESCLSSDYTKVKEIRNSNKSCVISPVNGFLKFICFQELEHRLFYKCVHDEQKYEAYLQDWGGDDVRVSTLCVNDAYSYQVCGFSTKVTNSDVLCGGYFCENRGDFREMHAFVQCDQNCQDRKYYCGTDQSVDTIAINSTAPREWCDSVHGECCDDICDFDYCQDEALCGGYHYGLWCPVDKRDEVFAAETDFVPVKEICDGQNTTLCSDGRDEENCVLTSNYLNTCVHYTTKMVYNKDVIVPIFNYTRCTVLTDQLHDQESSYQIDPYCIDYLDQTNCTDVSRVGGYCLIKGFFSSVSKYVMCDFYENPNKHGDRKTGLCHDALEKKCYLPTMSTSKCKVHKHKMCNGKDDCMDGSDENDAMCFYNVPNFSCERWFSSNNSSFPYKWVKDGTRDCIGGEDENDDNWLVCKFKNKLEASKRKRRGNETCTNVFRCPSETGYVEQEELCDGIESCSMIRNVENNVCRIARDFPSITSGLKDDGLKFCESLTSDLLVSCRLQKLKGKWMETKVFGASIQRTEMYLPTSKVECINLFGEIYAYYSCMDLCLEPEASCPLNDKPLLHDSCPGQFLDRLYTVANDSYITFIKQEGSDYYHENYLQCENGKCVSHSEVCDLVDNCGDLSDEKGCINQIVCEDTLENEKKHLISKGQKCDGIYDCSDLSDECNESCGREILHSWYLKGACWTMGILAVSLNAQTLAKSFENFRGSHSGQTLMTNALVSVINTGDFLIGAYLFILSVYDSIIFGRDFCKEQAVWLTGIVCSFLGILSTIGSQLSVFAMTVLSINRAWGIIRRKMALPSEIDKKAIFKTIVFVMAVVFASVSVAIIPLVPAFEEYFVQAMYYDPKYKVFIGFPNKARHINVLKEYFNGSADSQSVTVNMTWREIGEKVDKMFTDDYGTMDRMTVHFYGNDGICLYKYFVLTDDARRSRQSLDGVADITEHKGDPIVWFMLAINFFCFVCVAICYASIYFTAKKSSEESNSCQNPAVQEKNRALELKVTILVATDFLCWVPFIIISGLHNTKVIDASSWYIALSTILLPLNSVINPLIYSKDCENFLKLIIRKLNPLIDDLKKKFQSNRPIQPEDPAAENVAGRDSRPNVKITFNVREGVNVQIAEPQ